MHCSKRYVFPKNYFRIKFVVVTTLLWMDTNWIDDIQYDLYQLLRTILISFSNDYKNCSDKYTERVYILCNLGKLLPVKIGTFQWIDKLPEIWTTRWRNIWRTKCIASYSHGMYGLPMRPLMALITSSETVVFCHPF